MQASEDLQRASLGLYDDDTGPFPISGQQVGIWASLAPGPAICRPQSWHQEMLHRMRNTAESASNMESLASLAMQRQALERIGRARTAGLLQSVTANEMGISAASFFFIVKVDVVSRFNAEVILLHSSAVCCLHC